MCAPDEKNWESYLAVEARFTILLFPRLAKQVPQRAFGGDEAVPLALHGRGPGDGRADLRHGRRVRQGEINYGCLFLVWD